jgi:hypothetical protein
VVVVADVWTAVGIAREPSSRVGGAFFLFECEESKGVSRPNPRPTADAPTTVAVAQSCVTRMRQSWHSVRHVTQRFEVRQASHRRSRKQSSGGCETYQNKARAAAECGPMPPERKQRILTLGQVFILVRYQAAGELVETLVTTRTSRKGAAGEPRFEAAQRRDGWNGGAQSDAPASLSEREEAVRAAVRWSFAGERTTDRRNPLLVASGIYRATQPAARLI